MLSYTNHKYKMACVLAYVKVNNLSIFVNTKLFYMLNTLGLQPYALGSNFVWTFNSIHLGQNDNFMQGLVLAQRQNQDWRNLINPNKNFIENLLTLKLLVCT
jgi:hypothetical protein